MARAEEGGVVGRLKAHLAGDGTMNDPEVEKLYREAHKTPGWHEVSLEVIEAWVQRVVNGGM
jgi:hypothetical protein